jgi:hypothetical protein
LLTKNFAVYLHRRKLLNVSSLPISGLYLLAKASPKVHDIVEQRIRAGERPSVSLVKAVATVVEHMDIRSVAYVSPLGTANPSTVTTLPAIQREAEAKLLAQRLETFSRLVCEHDAHEDVNAMPVELHSDVAKDARTVVTYLSALLRCLAEFAGHAAEDHGMGETRH